jgi:AcrR family transcriptional regulator
MRDRNYGLITVGDIAARATVNRATFYLHFRDKDALLDHSLNSMTREALEQSAPLPARWDLDYLELLLTRLDRECPRSHKVFEVRLETQLQVDVRSPMIRFRPCSRPWATR